MATPRVLVLRAPGANCDAETQFAFQKAGASAERVHLNRIRENPALLHRYQILAIPGGFTYGDNIAAGKILANQLAHFLGNHLRKFRDAEKLIVGICNGFQVLLKAGLIIIPDEDGPLLTLTQNASGRFEDRWVELAVSPGKCPFLTGLERIALPVAHAEGRLVFREAWILNGLEQAGQLVLRYANGAAAASEYPYNPSGSEGGVAGICDASGRVLGLMPHPERHLVATQSPRYRQDPENAEGDGFRIFRNAVEFFAL